MKILVTGGYGQLGSELKQIEKNYPDWKFLFTDMDTLDITNSQAVNNYYAKHRPDFVINCAAYTAVDKAESDSKTAALVNAAAPGILAKAAAEIGAGIIQISTDYVFDGTAFCPITETEKVNPKGVYGQTKLEGEQNCLAGNSKSIIIRTSWLYSAFGNNFVKTMLRLGNEREQLRVIVDQIGTPTYAADLATVILSILKFSEKKTFEEVAGIYHFSNEGVASWYDFAKAIFEIAGVTCNVFPISTTEYPTPAKRPYYSVLNKSKIKNTFALQIPYWKESLIKCIKKIGI